MRINTDYRDGVYYILNHDQVIGRYRNWQAFARAWGNLGRVRQQLTRPEAFCNCKDIASDRQNLPRRML